MAGSSTLPPPSAACGIPLSAYLTPTNVSDNRVVLSLVEQLPEEVRFVLGDTHYDAPEVRAGCLASGKFLVASGKGPYPHTDPGVEVRRIFHRLRNISIETSERALQGCLRVPHGGTHQGPKRHRALRAWGGLRLPVGVA